MRRLLCWIGWHVWMAPRQYERTEGGFVYYIQVSACSKCGEAKVN